MIGRRAVLGCCVMLTSAAGCDYLFQLDHIDRGRDAASTDATKDGAGDAVDAVGWGGPCETMTPTFRDTFDGPLVCSQWDSKYDDTGTTVVEDGMLKITANANSVAGCKKNTSLPFGKGVTAVVPEVVRGAGAYTVLQIHDANLQILASGEDNKLRFQTSASADIGTPVTYAATMKWWRIRPGASAIVGEYSTDGTNWIMLGSQITTVPTLIGIEITVGAGNSPSMGTGTFDELTLCP